MGGQIASQQAEVLLKTDFVEVNAGGLQIAILEVVQIEHHAHLVEGRLRIANGEVEVLRPLELQTRQQAHGLPKQVHLLRIVASAGLTPAFQGVEQ